MVALHVWRVHFSKLWLRVFWMDASLSFKLKKYIPMRSKCVFQSWHPTFHAWALGFDVLMFWCLADTNLYIYGGDVPNLEMAFFFQGDTTHVQTHPSNPKCHFYVYPRTCHHFVFHQMVKPLQIAVRNHFYIKIPLFFCHNTRLVLNAHICVGFVHPLPFCFTNQPGKKNICKNILRSLRICSLHFIAMIMIGWYPQIPIKSPIKSLSFKVKGHNIIMPSYLTSIKILEKAPHIPWIYKMIPS